MEKLENLIDLTPGADASLTEMPWDYCSGNFTATAHELQMQNTQKDSAAMSFGMAYSSEPEQLVNPLAADEENAAKEIVILGAGLVAAPAVEYLSRAPGRAVTVVSSVPGESAKLVKKIGRKNVVSMQLDAAVDASKIESLVKDADAVLSLLPATMHHEIADMAILHATPMVTASYVSDEMRALDERAKEAGVPILCEMGLDPGMDHMSAMKIIDEVKASGGKIQGFQSLCGGLPAPEAANNALMYKFSWSPRGVISASQNSAKYKRDGEIVEVEGNDLLLSAKDAQSTVPTLSLEELPNRDSLMYGDVYSIADADTIYRGTLRYAGWSKIMESFRALGLSSREATSVRDDLPATWPELMEMVHSECGISKDEVPGDAAACLQWLGVYDKSAPLDTAAGTVIDAFCSLLEKRLAFEENERDMVVMHHIIDVERENAAGKEQHLSTYIGFGSDDPSGDSIMAKTVGLTAAVGVELLLASDSAAMSGVMVPVEKEIYEPALDLLAKEGIVFDERVVES